MRAILQSGLAASVVIVSLSAQGSVAFLPNPVRSFLSSHPGYRLLERGDVDPQDVGPEDELEAIGVGEWTGDRWADVAAVVVSMGRPKLFGIVAFHGSGRMLRKASVPSWSPWNAIWPLVRLPNSAKAADVLNLLGATRAFQ